VPPAPSIVRVQSRHSHSLVIQWQAPYPPHGIITQYLVKYRRHNMPYYVPVMVILPPTSHTYNVTALMPNFVYDFQVFNSINRELITNYIISLVECFHSDIIVKI